MASFIRNHPTVEASTSAATISTALSAEVPVGRLLVASLVDAGGTSVLGLSKPGGESAVWSRIGEVGVTTADGDTRASFELWAIRTTVAWASAQTVTATWDGVVAGRAIGIAEFDGVTVTVVSSGYASTNQNAGAPTTVTAATSETMRAGDLVVQGGVKQLSVVTETASGGSASGTRQALAAGSPASRFFVTTAYLITGAGGRFVTFSGASASKGALIVGLRAADYPPNAPALTVNASGGTLDRARTIRLGWAFDSPNAIDSQSAYDLRYRLTGDTSWTTVTAMTTNTFRDFVGGTFAAGDYEWQVQYYGALGKASGWSTSGFFTAADAPDGPTITYPIDGQTLDQFETMAWSVPAQDVYQIRRVADDAGDPDPDAIYEDTGEVTDSTDRSLPLNFSVNNRTEHVQLRVKVDDLWSEWDDVRVDVDYTEPPAPSRILYPNGAPLRSSLLVVIDNPAPAGDDPAAVYNDVYVDDGNGPERRATGVATNGSWLYETPVSGRDYSLPGRLWVLAVAANGTTSSSGG